MPSTLRLEIVPHPETKGFAVRPLVDGAEPAIIAVAVGADPDDLLWPPEAPALAATDVPRAVVVAICDCGVRGCGDVSVEIARRGATVEWRAADGTVLTFDAAAYDAEVARAAADRRWESPDRTAARLVRAALPVEHLTRWRLAFEWASVHLRPATFTIAFTLEGDSFQLFLHVPWPEGAPVDDVVARALALLATAPRDWPDVEYSAMRTGRVAPPRLAGPGWRPYSTRTQRP